MDFEHPLASLAHCRGPGSTAAFWLRLRKTWSRASTAEVLRLRAAAIENTGRPDPCISINRRSSSADHGRFLFAAISTVASRGYRKGAATMPGGFVGSCDAHKGRVSALKLRFEQSGAAFRCPSKSTTNGADAGTDARRGEFRAS